jgi:DNA repair ATPase RecN
MRYLLSRIVVVLEFACALFLAALASNLPGDAEVDEVAQKADHATTVASGQVQVLRKGVADLRRPELQKVFDQLQQQMAAVTKMLNEQSIDFTTLEVVRDALGNAATGLDDLKRTIDPGSVQKIADGLGETATFLETKLAPGAEQAAAKIENATLVLQKNGHSLRDFVTKAPLDLNAIRQVRAALTAFAGASKNANEFLASLQLNNALASLQSAADITHTAAETADKVGQGKGLHKVEDAIRDLANAVEQLDKKMLPEVRRSLIEARKVLDGILATLDAALDQQEKIEPLLKDLPNQITTLADALPRFGSDLAGILRETGRIKSTATALRHAEDHVNAVIANWPKLQGSLGQGAQLLRASQQRLDVVVKNRATYETAIHETAALTGTFGEMIAVLKSQLNKRLDEEDQILREMEIACQDTANTIPGTQKTAARMLQIARWTFWVVAMIPFCYGLLHVYNLLSRQSVANQPC